MNNLGDYDASTVIYGKFTTYQPSTGANFLLGGTPALSVYKDNSTTQSTSGVTLTASFDSVTGLNHFAIDTSSDGTFYSAGSFFDIVITTGTVDGVSVVGSVVGQFTIRKTAALKPTTAGRALDVSSGGEAGVDWANVGSPTTSLNLSGTTIATTQQVDLNTIKTQTVTAAAGVTFPTSIASPTNITAGTITTVTNLTNAPTAGDFTATMKTSIGTAVAASAVASVTGNVGGNVTGSIGSLATQAKADVNAECDTALADYDAPTNAEMIARTLASASYATATALATAQTDLDTITGSNGVTLATSQPNYAPAKVADIPTAATVAAAVWDLALSGHTSSGSTGEALNAAGAAGDPWTTSLPGAYGAGSAGYIIGTNIDALISSRMATYTQPTGFLAATFPAGTIANTTNITAGTIATVTNLTNAPTAGDFTATMKTSIGTAVAASAVASVTGSVGGNVTGSVGSVLGNVGGTVATVTNLTNAPTNGDFTATMKTSIGTAVSASAVASVTGNVGGNVTGSVGSVIGNVGGTVATVTNLTNAPTNGDLTATMKTSVQTAAAAALTAYDPPTNAEMEARTLVAANYATAANLATVNSIAAAIKLVTDEFTFDAGGGVNSNITYINSAEVGGDGSVGNPWGPA